MYKRSIANVHYDIYIYIYIYIFVFTYVYMYNRFLFKFRSAKTQVFKIDVNLRLHIVVIQRCRSLRVPLYNFHKKLCHAFFYASTIQFFHVRFFLELIQCCRSDSREQILFLLTNICFIFGSPSADRIYLIFLSSLFSLFFFLKRTTCISDAMTRLI